MVEEARVMNGQRTHEYAALASLFLFSFAHLSDDSILMHRSSEYYLVDKTSAFFRSYLTR
jgi:hypothetical protein